MPLTNLPISKCQKLNGSALALAAALGCAVLIPRPALAQWADCASAPTNSKQCVPSGNGNVGIGTTSPLTPLHVTSTSNSNPAGWPSLMVSGDQNKERIQIRSSVGAAFQAFQSRGTELVPSAIQAGDTLGYYQIGGYTGSVWTRGGWMSGIATENWGANSMGAAIAFSTNPNNSGTAAIAERMRIDQNGNVGIGTTTPGAMLGVHQPTASPAVTQAIFSSPYVNAGDYQQILFAYDQNNLVTSAGIRAIRYATADYGASLAFLTSAHAPGGAVTERMRIDANGNVGIGTTAPTRKFDVNGTIGAREVVVTNTGWADYVFKPGYKLRPLTEVAAFVKENGHLPEIPSEAEVKQNGVSMGEMQAKLLAKVEELTLHMIQQNDRNDQLQGQNARLEERNAELLKRIERLEARQQ